MLLWYRELLRLRREHIMHGERTCHAEWISENTLRMQIPAANPEVIVLAKIKGDEDIPMPKGAREVLSHGEDGFAVRVFVTRSY